MKLATDRANIDADSTFVLPQIKKVKYLTDRTRSDDLNLKDFTSRVKDEMFTSRIKDENTVDDEEVINLEDIAQVDKPKDKGPTFNNKAMVRKNETTYTANIRDEKNQVQLTKFKNGLH